MSSPTQRTVLLIDDDELSRAVLEVFLTEAGWTVVEAESGDAAVRRLRAGGPEPGLVMSDLQMPGLLHGPALLQELRPLLRAGTPVVAMSGSEPAPETVRGFDGFLRKPIAPERLEMALAELAEKGRLGEAPAAAPAEGGRRPVLDDAVFTPLQGMLAPEQMRELFLLSFAELGKHLARMEAARAAGDGEAFRHSAHTIKGSFAIAGALELADLGARLEMGGGSAADQAATLAQIPAAAERLRRMLSTRGVRLELLPPSDQESV